MAEQSAAVNEGAAITSTPAPAEPVDSGLRNTEGQRIDAEGNVITETGAGGISLGTRREIAGGAITTELKPDPVTELAPDPLRFQRRYIVSKLAEVAGNIIGRAPDLIGFFGKGDVYHGNGGILVNVDTLEKVRVQDGYKFLGDEVYANSRDLPHALVDGDLAENLKARE